MDCIENEKKMIWGQYMDFNGDITVLGDMGLDTHVYKNHVEALKEQISREPRKFPKLLLKDRCINNGGE
ncbi:unnamed protein product [Medioppia subpectinata]|uniref:Thymidylate synthase n=1 Tax=Medioppia subpectinata TaxID=1979941 RepID=A0A7R9KE64_9ACAR|nr:unnamed protein product [Medioppia subpectinata]CAG2101674.1 unnamed protein product [Medioppia subpectinata]